VREELNKYDVFDDSYKKEKWVENLKKRISWEKSEEIFISERVQTILKYS